MLFHHFQILLFRQQLSALQVAHQAWVADHVGFKVEHPLDVAQRHVKHHAKARRKRLQEPDVRGRRSQFDMAHAVAPNLGQRHFDAAFLADHATMLEALVLAAQALVVLDRTKNLGAEQAIAFRLEGTIVDGFGLLDFAKGPGTDLFGRGQANGNRVKLFFGGYLLEQIEQCFHRLTPKP